MTIPSSICLPLCVFQRMCTYMLTYMSSSAFHSMSSTVCLPVSLSLSLKIYKNRHSIKTLSRHTLSLKKKSMPLRTLSKDNGPSQNTCACSMDYPYIDYDLNFLYTFGFSTNINFQGSQAYVFHQHPFQVPMLRTCLAFQKPTFVRVML